MIDVLLLLAAGFLTLAGLWLLFRSTTEAWQEWRR